MTDRVQEVRRLLSSLDADAAEADCRRRALMGTLVRVLELRNEEDPRPRVARRHKTALEEVVSLRPIPDKWARRSPIGGIDPDSPPSRYTLDELAKSLSRSRRRRGGAFTAGARCSSSGQAECHGADRAGRAVNEPTESLSLEAWGASLKEQTASTSAALRATRGPRLKKTPSRASSCWAASTAMSPSAVSPSAVSPSPVSPSSPATPGPLSAHSLPKGSGAAATSAPCQPCAAESAEKVSSRLHLANCFGKNEQKTHTAERQKASKPNIGAESSSRVIKSQSRSPLPAPIETGTHGKIQAESANTQPILVAVHAVNNGALPEQPEAQAVPTEATREADDQSVVSRHPFASAMVAVKLQKTMERQRILTLHAQRKWWYKPVAMMAGNCYSITEGESLHYVLGKRMLSEHIQHGPSKFGFLVYDCAARALQECKTHYVSMATHFL